MLFPPSVWLEYSLSYLVVTRFPNDLWIVDQQAVVVAAVVACVVVSDEVTNKYFLPHLPCYVMLTVVVVVGLRLLDLMARYCIVLWT